MFAITVGCSSGGTSPSVPEEPALQPAVEIPEAETVAVDAGCERSLIGLWEFFIDTENVTIETAPLRNANPHFDITNMLLPPICPDCMLASVNYWDPVSRIFDIEVTLKNPYTIAGRDVRGIVFTNDLGHRLLNADDWSPLYDVPGGIDINPFRSFAKNQGHRIFAGHQSYSENFSIILPAPPQLQAIQFAVDGCWLGNCREPYEISNYEQLGEMGDFIGAEAFVEVDVYDWQDDISKVSLVAPEITGEPFTQFEHVDGSLWRLKVMNNAGALGGEHIVRIIAASPNPTDVALYDFVSIMIQSIAPHILGIQPDSAGASVLVSGAVVTGTTFQGPGATVILQKTGAPDIVAESVVVQDGQTIICDLDIPLDAPLGMYDLRVTNGSGYYDYAESVFEVLCPLPMISGINPDFASIDSSLSGVTITGDDFLEPVVVKLKRAGEPVITASNVTVISPQEIHCNIDVSCSQTGGLYDVEVTNYCGEPGTGAELFEVYCPTPSVTSAFPAEGDAGTLVTGILIVGTGFVCDNASVSLVRDGEPDIPGINLDIQGQEIILCDFGIPIDAMQGMYDVQVVNDCGASTVTPDLFEVMCYEPVATGIDVTQAEAGTYLSSVTIHGSAFKGPPIQVKLKMPGEPDIDGTNVSVIDIHTIICDFDIPPIAETGWYDIEVTSACGASGTGADLFEITCPTPVVSSIQPDFWASYPGVSINNALIAGSAFSAAGGVNHVYLSNGGVQIPATDIIVISDSVISCDFNIKACSYSSGMYDIIVITDCEGSGTGLFEVFDNLLYSQKFVDSDGGCTSLGTHGGYKYCGDWWASSSPCGAPYPNNMYSALLTPAFDVPSVATDVHVRMVHAMETDILEGAFIGWTDDDGVTIYGDICDTNDYWHYESGQNYNGDDFYSPIYEGMGTYISCEDVTGWESRYWRGGMGSPGNWVWSQFHCGSSANLIGMTGAKFMAVFLSDVYVESSAGHEISELLIWYDPPVE